MYHELTLWTQTLLSNDPPLPRYSILHISVAQHWHVCFHNIGFSKQTHGIQEMKSLVNTSKQHRSVLQRWHRQGMTQEYILYFLVLDYSHSCLVLPNSLAHRESVKRTWEKPVLSFPRTDVEQLPASTLWSNQSINLD